MAFIPQSGPSVEISANRSFTILVAGVAALGALMFGFDIAIISGATPFIQRYFSLTDISLGWAVSCLLLGCIAGSGSAGWLAERFGRRAALIVTALLFAVSSILTGVATSFPAFVLARVAGGFAVGTASIISPMYIAEISPGRIRGRMVSLCQLGITLGIVVSYLINYCLKDAGPSNWRWMFISGAVPSLGFFALLFLVPESPRWLFSSGKEDAALRILTKLGGSESAQREMKYMRSAADSQSRVSRRLSASGYRNVMFLGVLLAMLVQMCGMNAVISYAPIILGRAGNHIDTALFQTFIIGAVNLLATFVAVAVVDRLGRKPLYMAGSMGMFASLVLIGLSFSQPALSGRLGLVFILLFVTSFAACIGPVFWILMSEMFPSSIRAGAMSLAVLTTWSANFVVVLVFPWVFSHLGGARTFWSIAVVPLLMLVVTWKYLPETKGRTLEEIDAFWTPAATP